MEDTNKEDIVEQYVQGQLKGSRLEEFKQKLALDDRLRKQVEVEEAIIKNLKREGRHAYKLKLQRLHQQMNAGTESNKPAGRQVSLGERRLRLFSAHRYWWLVAASVALFLVCTLLYTTYFTQPTNPDTLFAAYYQPPSSMQGMRGSSNQDGAEAKTAAFASYNQGKYGQSIALFKRALAKEKDETVLFYLGNAYLAADMPNQAIQTFSEYQHTYREYEVEVNWYMSLSYLKTGNVPEAKKILEALAKRENRFRDQADHLLKALNQL